MLSAVVLVAFDGNFIISGSEGILVMLMVSCEFVLTQRTFRWQGLCLALRHGRAPRGLGGPRPFASCLDDSTIRVWETPVTSGELF
jgi:hypothetical protein